MQHYPLQPMRGLSPRTWRGEMLLHGSAVLHAGVCGPKMPIGWRVAGGVRSGARGKIATARRASGTSPPRLYVGQHPSPYGMACE